MAYCIQCGEDLSLDTEICPTCRRPVGASSIGAAMERKARPGTLLAIRVLAGLAVAGLLIVLVAAFLRDRAASRVDPARVAKVAAASLVTVVSGEERPGVVLREVEGAGFIVAVQAQGLEPGDAVKVQPGGRPAFVILTGSTEQTAALALVFVPSDGGAPLTPAKIVARPRPDEAVVALASSGGGAAGRILSYEDGPGAGVLVHDAPVAHGSRGLGLYSPDGRLLALPTMRPEAGENLAVSASALLSQLLVHRLAVPSGSRWTEHPVAVPKGAELAVLVRGGKAPGFQAKVGEQGTTARARRIADEVVLLRPQAKASGALQLGWSRPHDGPAVSATVVMLAPR